MKNVVLVGVGGIGFRHFQAIMNCANPVNLCVVDLSEEAIQRCIEEEKNSKSKVEISYSREISNLPKEIDILIIATSSIPRCSIFKQIVKESNIKNVIFEKFLFPRITEYDEVSEILEKKNIRAFVNCPGRMFPGYKNLKNEIDKSKGGIAYISGSNWGLACNAIHFIDQVGFLFDSYEELRVDTSLLDDEVKESKRNGYIEFTGRAIFSLGRNIKIVMDSFSTGNVPFRITLANGNNLYTISEGERWMLKSADTGFEKTEFATFFQSQLTDKVIDELLNGKDCELTAYENTKQWHKAMLTAFSKIYSTKEGDKSMCPIT